MKKILSMLIAALIVVTGFAFPVSASDAAEFTTITADMISVEGATVEYDSYLSAYKITPDATGETVTVRLTENLYFMAIWLPATAADDSLSVFFENDDYIGGQNFTAGHKFELAGIGFEGENFWMSYTPSDTYSIYLYDKMTGMDYPLDITDIANGSLAQYDEEYLDLDTYEVDRYTKYYWDEDIVFNESFMVIEEKDGTIAPNAMMYEIDRVISVKNSYLNVEYVYGADYLIEDGKLVIPEGSSIKSYKYADIFKDNKLNGYWETLNGNYVYAGQHDMYFVGYLNITYTVKDTWNGPVPESKGMYLDNITEKLNTPGETVKILGIGDSIAGGANVSSDIGYTGVEPYADPWSQMTSKAIQERYPDVTVEYDVIAQGGATAAYAIERMNDILAFQPDLIMIEFGTNECMAGETSQYYIDTLVQAIDAINENLPDCDIILLAPIISNPLIFPADWFYAYADALYSLEREGVAVSDTVSILQYLISRKDYIDMTGDFLCHPNDFANRVFVQSVLKTLEMGTEEEYINGIADRILTYRYENEFDPADWAELCSLAENASAEIRACATAEDARRAYIDNIDVLDAVPTSAENIANSALDVSKLIFTTNKPMDAVGSSTNVTLAYNSGEKALSAMISGTRTFNFNLDYTKGDNTVSADDYDYVVITMKAPLTNGTRATQTRLTYTTETGACATTTVTLILDGQYHSYVIDMSGDGKWAGDITSLKIQPFVQASTNDVLYISSVILATDAENASDIAIERERAANGDAAEAVTYLMSDEATSSMLTVPGGESYIAGDADGDGRVTAKDSLLLRINLVGGSVTVANPAALDVDCNGKIDVYDSATIKMTLSGKIEKKQVGGAMATVSYSTQEQAAKVEIHSAGAVLTVDMTDSGLSADMFKYITVCAKNANGEAVGITVTYTYADGSSQRSVTVASDALFNAESAKFTEASGDIVSVSFVFDCEAGETVYFDSFVLTPTLSAADNAEIVRVGAANLY